MSKNTEQGDFWLDARTLKYGKRGTLSCLLCNISHKGMFVYFWVVTTKEIFSLFFLFIFSFFFFLPYHFFLDGLENRTKPISTPYDGRRWWDAGGTRTCVHLHVSRPLYHCATDCACCSTLCMCYTHKFCAVVFHSALLRVL